LIDTIFDSSSHVGFCALRLEPIWTSLGQAAGHAAHLAVEQKCSVADVPLKRLQSRLHARGSATIYVSDVPPDHADFAVVQWWGLPGGWHGLAPRPDTPGERGRNLHGQYFAAFPNHTAELDRPLDGNREDRRWVLIDGNGAYSLGDFDGTRFVPHGEMTYLGETTGFEHSGRTRLYTKDI
jgi:hypothetical protein